MVQDIYPHKLHNEFDPNVQATQEDVLLCIVNGRILIHLNCFENKEVVFPKVSDIQVENVEYRYLFSIDSTKYFLWDWSKRQFVCGHYWKTFGRLVSRY